RRGSDRSAPLRALGRRLGRIGVGALITSSGQRGLGRGCGRAAGVPGDARVHCWDRQDSTTSTWVPQGVTSSSDASADENWGGRPMLVSWYSRTGVRVTFVNPDRGSYQHVLLVYPRMSGGRATYTDIAVHAGGISWFGRTLYVADTSGGLREFDMTHIYDLARSKNGSRSRPGQVGLHGGKYHAHGYRFVMPQTGSWHYARGRAPHDRCIGRGPLRTSWTSIDRTGPRPALIAGEYCSRAAPRGRVVTWPLDEGAGLAARGGVARADWAAYLPERKIQGGVRAHGSWWFSHNRDTASGTRRGQFLMTTWDGDEWGEVQRRPASYGPEDLSYFRSQDRIWTVAEHAGRRALWAAIPAHFAR
ncbi:hypothetical protein, partial [Actinomadura roseirufa]|uniref:hypothetical protein n=1 Tax=Actinomadura roseirufa TaxID=2094049 RepID=UPI0013F15181